MRPKEIKLDDLVTAYGATTLVGAILDEIAMTHRRLVVKRG